MKHFKLHLIIILLALIPTLLSAQSKKEKKAKENKEKMELYCQSLQSYPLDSLVSQNSNLAYQQAIAVLDNFFEKSLNDDGEIVYAPIMITMEMNRPVISMDTIGNIINSVTTTQFKVPLITLAPFNSLGIEKASWSKNGSIDPKFEQVPLPSGLTTILDAFTNSIQPITISE